MSTTITNQVSSLSNLPTPQFVNDSDGLNPLSIVNDMINSYQQTTGKTLYPAQVERLLINLYAYRETLVRNAIQNTGLQNLLAFATYPVLDYLGQLLSVTRLPAQSATATQEFVLANALTTTYTLPTGTQVGSNDGTNIFVTTAPLVFPAGQTTGYISVSSLATGTAANGYVPGQITVLLGGNALIASTTNTTTSANGASPETDDHFRTRIQAAPSQFSTAGPSGAYRYWSLSANQNIIDAFVTSTVPGTVNVYVLTGPILTQPASSPNTVGIASSAILADVSTTLNSTTVRPLCDTVVVSAVTEIDYQVTATITYYNNATLSDIQSICSSNANNLALDLANGLGQDLVPSQWVEALFTTGVYDIEITITANIAGGASLTPDGYGRFVFYGNPNYWVNCTSLTLNYVQSSEQIPLA